MLSLQLPTMNWMTNRMGGRALVKRTHKHTRTCWVFGSGTKFARIFCSDSKLFEFWGIRIPGAILFTIFKSALKYRQCICGMWVIVFKVLHECVESWFEVEAGLSYIGFVAGITYNFVYSTFFLIRCSCLCCGSYKLMQSCCRLKRYAYIGVFK